MKVLWLTSSPGGAGEYLKSNTPGRGWIASLESRIKNVDGIQLGVCFFHNGSKEFKFSYNNVTYYPIEDKLSTLRSKMNSKAFNEIWDTNLTHLLKAVSDFEPDIIQLFGTETGLGDIVGKTTVPIIIHIQGLLNPYISNWFPRGLDPGKVLRNSSLNDVLLRRDLYSEHKLARKLATREEHIIRNAKYFFGRTDWDRRVVRFLNTDARYFYCSEVLRPIMYERQWNPTLQNTFKIVSTINPQIYKGLDIVLETARLLKTKSNINFEWNIIGLQQENKVVRMIEKVKGERFGAYSVFFKGVKQGQELISELLNSSVFVHPSHIDNSPNSVCEAMILGMPVIAGNVGGMSSLIETGVNGVLYNSHDPYDLASILAEKSTEPEELQRLGNNGRRTAITRHQPETIVATVVDTYKQIVNGAV